MNRNKFYNAIDVNLQSLYDASNPSVAKISEIGKKYQFSNEPYKNYVLTIGDSILGIYKVADLPQKLQENIGVDEATAKAITQELLEFLSPVLEAEKTDPTRGTPEYIERVEKEAEAAEDQANEPTPEVTETLPALNIPTQNHTNTPNIQPETPEPEKSDDTLEPMRTMPEDIKKIHGYGAYRADEQSDSIYKSSQEDVQRPRLTDKPRYLEEAEGGKQ